MNQTSQCRETERSQYTEKLWQIILYNISFHSTNLENISFSYWIRIELKANQYFTTYGSSDTYKYLSQLQNIGSKITKNLKYSNK